MIPLLYLVPAWGAVLRVPEDHATVGDAVSVFRPGDVIQVGEGRYVWAPDARALSGLHLRGAGSRTEVDLVGSLFSSGSLHLERMALVGGGKLFANSGTVTLIDVDATSPGGLVSGSGTLLRVERVTAGAPGGSSLLSGTFTRTEISGLTVLDPDLDGPIVDVTSANGGYVEALHVEGGELAGAALRLRGGPFVVRTTSLRCGTSVGGILADDLSLSGVGVWGWDAKSGALLASPKVSVTFSTLGGTGSGPLIADGAVGTLRDTFVAGSHGAPGSRVVVERVLHRPGTPTPPAGSMEGEAGFWGSNDPNDCARVTLFPDRGSPLVDGGDAASRDRDGSRADIGATGGPSGLALVEDADGDRCPAEDDCDETNADIRPGNQEIWYDGVDRDCDGANDFDADGDGYRSIAYGGDDCEDLDTSYFPGADDPCDGGDQDCDGFDGYDCDEDGHASILQGGLDCDDTNADIAPGLSEDVDPRDRDCDGVRDPVGALEPLTCASIPAALGGWPLGIVAAMGRIRRRGRRGARVPPG